MTQNNLAFTENELIPEGYKKTEVGIIPNDWSVESLQNLCRSSITYGIVQCGPHIPNGIPYIRVSDMNSSELNVDEMLRTSPEIASSFGRSKVEDGDIVYALRGKLGEVKMVGAAVSGANLTQGTARIAPKNNIDNRYLLWTLRSPQALKQAVKEAKGSTFVEITLGNLKGIGVPLPSSREEQQKIATALSDTDALISELEKLIEKKQAIKTATMQQLLTGKTRLPEFALREDGTPKAYKESELGQIPEDWRALSIGSDTSLKARIGWQALTTAEYLKEGNYYLVTGTDFNGGLVNWNSCCYVSEWRYKQDKNIQLQEHDVLVTKDGTIGKVGFIENLPLPATLNSGVFVVRPKLTKCLPRFLFYILTSSYFDDFVKLITAGSTIVHLYQKDFVNFKFYLPHNIEEQSAIANILADLDTELTKLNLKLDKFKNIKQGMMQELLTGKTRLV